MLSTIKKTLRYPLNFMADWLTFTFIDKFYKVDKPYPLPAYYHCPVTTIALSFVVKHPALRGL